MGHHRVVSGRPVMKPVVVGGVNGLHRMSGRKLRYRSNRYVTTTNVLAVKHVVPMNHVLRLEHMLEAKHVPMSIRVLSGCLWPKKQEE